MDFRGRTETGFCLLSSCLSVYKFLTFMPYSVSWSLYFQGYLVWYLQICKPLFMFSDKNFGVCETEYGSPLRKICIWLCMRKVDAVCKYRVKPGGTAGVFSCPSVISSGTVFLCPGKLWKAENILFNQSNNKNF